MCEIEREGGERERERDRQTERGREGERGHCSLTAGASSMIFWCLLCTLQSLSNRWMVFPCLSPNTCTSTCLQNNGKELDEHKSTSIGQGAQEIWIWIIKQHCTVICQEDAIVCAHTHTRPPHPHTSTTPPSHLHTLTLPSSHPHTLHTLVCLRTSPP